MSDSKSEKPRVLRRSKGKLQPEIKPTVLKYRGSKRKRKSTESESRKKYSEGLEDIQVLEGDALRVAQRAVKALSKGVDTYERERQRSAEERTEGAIEDFLNNSAKAASVYLKETSEIPVDIAESINTTSYRKRLRNRLRRSSRLIRLFRI